MTERGFRGNLPLLVSFHETLRESKRPERRSDPLHPFNIGMSNIPNTSLFRNILETTYTDGGLYTPLLLDLRRNGRTYCMTLTLHPFLGSTGGIRR